MKLIKEKRVFKGPLSTPLQQAKEWLKTGFQSGDSSECPCCRQNVKKYKRNLSGGAVRLLIALYNKFPRGKFIHVNDIRIAGGGAWASEFAILAYWNLIEEMVKDKDKDTRTSGMWRISDHGVRFVIGASAIPKYINTYNNRLLGTEGAFVNIHQCIGKKFSYSELMSR
jgi:hypothetical protein